MMNITNFPIKLIGKYLIEIGMGNVSIEEFIINEMAEIFNVGSRNKNILQYRIVVLKESFKLSYYFN